MTATAATGPSGSRLESQVGATYLLALLLGAEPRGLTGTTPERVEFQRAGEGHPLDDVIVHARDKLCAPATLEVQVKRTVTFTASDSEFKDVVAQMAKAGQRSDFWTSRYELGIATARHSAKLDGAYQDVLGVARQTAAKVCAARLVRPHAFNADMRQFVAIFRRNLELAGTVVDDISIWPWLARIQIHVYDFTAEASTAATLAREQCLRALADEHGSDAGRLWTALVDIAQAGAVHGGDRTREQLVAELREQGFQLRGEPRSIAGRRALHEASTQALADIGDRIAGVRLTRTSYLEEIRTAIDAGARYIEIRGEGGVGKSGVLKHLATLDTMQAVPLVLAPNRTPRGGWLSLKAALGFEGSLRELFVDLMATNCDSVYVDNVDRFEPDERTTANDVIREAARIPGMRLIVTARPRFGREEPSWLPKDALATFGAATVIQVENLSGQEMATLRDEASDLADLLSPGHPAVEIASNPYRLSRLVSWSTNAPLRSLRTETDMAQQWWQTADGLLDTTLRAARTLLRDMANHALRSEAAFLPNAPDHAAIEALARSGSLRDLPDGRIDFQHDVLREWAVANLLHADPAVWNHLSLTRAASPTHARAVELAARMAIEGNADAEAWRQMVTRLSAAEVHPTWRREALLALVRSEAAIEGMDRARADLRANNGAMLSELVRLVRSIETIDVAANLAASAGLKQLPTQIGAWGHIPSSRAWPHLFRWLLANENDLPPAAIPDIAAAYASWLFFEAITKKDGLSGRLLETLHHWLGEIERSQDRPWDEPNTAYFGDSLEEGALKELEWDLRNTILLYASKRPDLTAAYLDAQRTRRRSRDETVKRILQFSQTVAAAAPEALAALALHTLIPREPKRRREEYLDDHVFGFLDLQFLPASPAQGPFMDLLVAKSEVGLDLIRKLVDHAIKSRYGGQRTDNSDIVIGGPNPRKHPSALTYMWSRDSRDHCVTSALMALEAWAHRRIEAGDSVQSILDQVVPDGAPAAYLLVAVDVLLSHWPKTRTEALPYLGSPELLSLDRQRALHDKQPDFDLFALGALNKEPTGTATLKGIRARPSRRAALEDALNQMMHDEAKAERDIVVALVREASIRLGKPAPTAGFFDPPFMAVHALHRLDPVNWEDFEHRTASGEVVQAKRYLSPPSEVAHLAPQQGTDLSKVNDLNMELAILAKLDKPEEVDDAFLTTAIAWAQASAPSERDRDPGDTRQQAVLTAALLAMQFGGDRRPQLRGWAVSLFKDAIRAPSNMSHAVRKGIKFNPAGIALAGLLFADAHSTGSDTLEEILQAATRDDVAAAHGLGYAAPSLGAALRPELVRALLRIAFAAEIYAARPRDFDLDRELTEQQDREGKAAHEAAVKVAVAREREWLAALDPTPEPPWPILPPLDSRQSQGTRVHFVDETEIPTHTFGYQGAAIWLSQCLALRPSARHRAWVRELVSAVAPWTHKANGAGLNQHQRMYSPREWNEAYFELAVECLHGMSAADIEALLTAPLESYPDEPFLDVVEILVPALDQAYFGEGLSAESAVPIRTALAKRLMHSYGWKRLIGEKSGSVEVHLSPAIAALLFNQCRRFREPGCVLLPKGMERVGPFVPMLLEMARGAPCPYTATLVMDFVAAAPAPIAIPLLIAAAEGWLQQFREYRPFWTDTAVGNRVCTYLASVSDLVSAIGDDGSGRAVLHDLVATLVQLGFAQARPIEIALAQ